MRKDHGSARAPAPIGWMAAAAGAVAILAAIAAWSSAADEKPAPGTVTIVGTPSPPLSRPTPTPHATPVDTTGIVVPPDRAIAHVRQVYPLLSNASMHCDREGCVLDATILPLNAQADLDKRQEMLLGGLAAVLAADGYDLIVPFQFDEIDDNRFHLKASVSYADKPA